MRRKIPRIERTLFARCKRYEPEAYQAVGHRYAASVYHALLIRVRDEERARELFREVFASLGQSVHLLGRHGDLTEHVRQTTEKVCAGRLPGGLVEPVVIAPANGVGARPLGGGEAQALWAELGEEAGTVMRGAAEELRPELAALQRRGAGNLVVALGALVLVLGVLAMAAYARGYGLDPRGRARRVRLELIQQEITAADLPAAVGEAPEESALETGDQRAARQLEELSLTLEEIVNADAKTVWSELPYLQRRVDAFDLVEFVNDLAEQRSGSEREALARTGLVLEQIVNL